MDTLMPGRAATVTSWVAQVVAAAILGQTLFFKFSGATESRYIFTALGVEPWGRYGTGVLELVAVTLLLIPRTAALGAVLAAGLMAGALLAHVTRLGIEVQGDHGLLFGLALTVFIASLVVLTLRRRELPIIGALL
jgi:uncharacterized membrane protein YphA (DoxX/SURF4 family)